MIYKIPVRKNLKNTKQTENRTMNKFFTTILTALLIAGCANSPEDMRSTKNTERVFDSKIKGPLNEATKCMVRNLDDLIPNKHVIYREPNSSGVVEIQQRVYGELLIMHDLINQGSSVKVTTYVYPRDLTPWYTRKLIEKVVARCA
jgi:hypothetical protein